MHQSFFTYKRGRWLWIAVVLSALCIAVYGWHGRTLAQPPNGGTWYGYTLGTIGALLILWLLYLGRRKRNYRSTLSTVQGWVSAHVYLGTALLVVATLHTGIQFGWNVHTLAYALMCLVIFSGFFGVWAYLRYPARMTSNADGRPRADMYTDVADIDKQINRLAGRLTDDMRQTVGSAVDRTALGGSAWAQLRARDSSQVALPGGTSEPNVDQRKIIEVLVERLSQSSHAETNTLIRQIIDLIGQKARILQKIRRDIQIQAVLRIWLYVHVPLSFGTVAALIAHVVSVFLYW